MSQSAAERTLLLDQIAQCYGIEPAQLDCLTDNPDDGVYGFTRQGQDFVVKYTLPTMRSYSTLQGQVDWINFLAENGAPVSRNGMLWVIDFDGCCYHWFIMDIATALYFTLWERPPEQRNADFAAFVLEHMLVGYGREHLLGAAWLERLPTCLTLVEMNIYVAILAYNQVALRSNLEAVPPKHRALLDRYRHNIEHDVPYIESAQNPWV